MAKKSSAKKASSKKAPTKGEVYGAIAEKTALSRKQVAAVFNELSNVVKKSLKANGQVTVPGIAKLVVKSKPKVPAGPRRNPFTGETKMMPAKPASKTVRARPIKAVKDMV
jgi:DNA-binding protein HU-beta